MHSDSRTEEHQQLIDGCNNILKGWQTCRVRLLSNIAHDEAEGWDRTVEVERIMLQLVDTNIHLLSRMVGEDPS